MEHAEGTGDDVAVDVSRSAILRGVPIVDGGREGGLVRVRVRVRVRVGVRVRVRVRVKFRVRVRVRVKVRVRVRVRVTSTEQTHLLFWAALSSRVLAPL